MSELFLDMGKTEIVYATFGDQDEVDRPLKYLGMMPKDLTYPTLDTVADNGSPDLL